MTPMKKARKERGWTLADLASAIRANGTQIDAGNLSRIERGAQVPSPELAEAICKAFDGKLDEIQVFYPERFAEGEAA